MLNAVVLLNVERARINQVAEKVSEMAGISEVYSVAGRYDLAAIVRVRNNDELAEIVTHNLLAVPGITHSETLIAFRVFSRHDLDRMFAIGLDPA